MTITQKKAIYLLLDSRDIGGIESHVLQLAEGLHNFKQPVVVVFLKNYGKHPLRDALDQRGIRHITLNDQINALWKLIKKESPLAIHTHGYKAGIYGRLTAFSCHVPVITTYHAGEIASGKLAIYDWLDRITAVLANKSYAVSPQIAERLMVNANVFNNFINTEKITPSQGDEIAFVGRISHEKGPDYFVELARSFSQTSFHLYGNGPDLSNIKKHASDNLHIHGQQNDMENVWNKIGLLIMPSRHEGLPMAALEAMARGIPVLASNVGALDRLIEHEFNGWLVEPNNIEQLKKYLTHWLSMTNNEKATIQQAAKKIVYEHFSSHVAIPKLMSVYQHCI
jgi:glycosyltransferase involved in cell wall biosynthesis